MVAPVKPLLRPRASAHPDVLAIHTITDGCSVRQSLPRMVNAAASEIYRAWRRYLPEPEARAEAEAFSRRFHVLIDGPLAPLPDERELNATTLDAVADATGAP